MKILNLVFLVLAGLLGLGVWLIRSLFPEGKRTMNSGRFFTRSARREKRPRASHYCSYAVYSKRQID